MKVIAVVAVMVLGGCCTKPVVGEMKIGPELLTKCTTPLPTAASGEDTALASQFKAIVDIDGQCAVRHNKLVDVLIKSGAK